VTRFRFVRDHQSEYPVKRLCALVECSRSGFYAWAGRALSDHYLRDVDLANEIYDIHVASQRTYGTPRVLGQLQHRNIAVGRKRVARIMAECGLVGAHGRKKWRKGKRVTSAPGPDLIERDFTAQASNERWMADITEFKCRDGKLFLAGILDLHDRGLAGWSMGNRQTSDIVVNALVMAIARRQPDGDLIHHADRGAQYTSGDLGLTMIDHGVTASFGRTGVCWDNATMEATWATIKREIHHIHGDWETMTRSQLRTVLFDYIETFYNRNRHQARLGHRTPNETYKTSLNAA
jgi:transposase InsO family protein